MDIDWAAPAAWANRSEHFRALVDRGWRYIGMEFIPRTIDARWSRLRDRWVGLPRHGNLLDAIEPFEVDGLEGVVLRYAALNWWKRTLDLDSASRLAAAAAFGAQLADVFQLILEHVKGSDRSLFLQPFAYIDLDLELRVGFECGANMRPPEATLDERAFVFVVGQLWSAMLETLPPDGIGKIIRRCVEVKPRARFSSLDKLLHACLDVSAPRGLRSGDRLSTWYQVEEAIGWRSRGERDIAFRRFRSALSSTHYHELAWWGASDTSTPVFIGPLPLPRPAPVLEPEPEPPEPPPPVFVSKALTPARTSYLEGREHLLARRLHEAQACFASAALLDPLMLEAQLLRGEVDRMLGRIRSTTGMSTPMPIDVPASLREVRVLVGAGRIEDAIAVLSTETYEGNVDAMLFRARLLALDGQYDRAASTFATITEGPHADEAWLGLARVTIDRGKPEAAISILDDLLATRPRDLGALEARARCLELLGRTDEASEAMKTFVAAVELASDARLARLQ